MNPKRLANWIGVLVLSLGLAGCEGTKIGDILADPGSFTNKEVTFAGEITNSMGGSIGPLSGGVYEISDGTGKLWVFASKRGVPSKGAHVGLKGTVSQSVTIMGRNYATVIRESSRKVEKND